jgi:hypothetical protein
MTLCAALSGIEKEADENRAGWLCELRRRARTAISSAGSAIGEGNQTENPSRGSGTYTQLRRIQ